MVPGTGSLGDFENALAGMDEIRLGSLDGEDVDSSGGGGIPLEPDAVDLDGDGGGPDLGVDAASGPPVGGEARPVDSAGPPKQPGQGADEVGVNYGDTGLENPKERAEREKREAAAKEARDKEIARLRELSMRPPERIGLFHQDRVVNILVAAGIGLSVGVLPASSASERAERTRNQHLVDEINESLENPLGVQEGEYRKPKLIAAEIAQNYGGVYGRFAGIWLVIAAAVGGALALASRANPAAKNYKPPEIPADLS